MSLRRLACSLWGLCVGLTLVGQLCLALNGRATHANSRGSPASDGVLGVLFLGAGTPGSSA